MIQEKYLYDMEETSVRNRVNEIFSLYESLGSLEYVAEPVTLLEHMSQTAQLAVRAGADGEVILAAFFHDIGHLCVARTNENDLEGLGTRFHEKVGAQYLRQHGFSERLVTLVENHVAAKRYLTARYPEYYRSLSKASKKTLELQGGRMSDREAAEFERSPHFEYSIKLRKWDEQAKRIHVPIIELGSLKSLTEKVLSANVKGETGLTHVPRPVSH